jgi:hypothetical protein
MFYHVSKKYLGNTVTLTPKVPGTALITEEGDIPRICTSKNLLGCIRGIVSIKNVTVGQFLAETRDCIDFMSEQDQINGPAKTLVSPSIYSSIERAYTPPNASDFRVNKEMWYLSDTNFTLIAFIDIIKLMYTGELDYTNEIQTVSAKALEGIDPELIIKESKKLQARLDRLTWSKLKDSYV